MLYDVNQLDEALKSDSPPLVVDVRFNLNDTEWGRVEYRKAHIPGALYAHLDADLSGEIINGETGRHPLPDKSDLVELFSSWGLKHSDVVVVYDQGHGGIAARLWWLLQWAGHENAAVLNGGWAAWTDAALPTESRKPQPVRADFEAHFNDELITRRESIEGDEAQAPDTLVDSRDAQRYHGIVEPIDPIAGHIPGAINLPFKENLDDSGLWLSPQQLRKRFEKIAGIPTFYCGSGVTACHNILAYSLAGLGAARLYPGSWSEWITDPSAPVVTSNSE